MIRNNDEYESSFIRCDGTLEVSHGGKCGIIDLEFGMNTDCVFDEISLFNTNYAVVTNNGKVGLINIGGEVVLDCLYDAISNFDDNYIARVLLQGQEGLYNTSNKWLLPPICDIIYPEYNNLYIFCQHDEANDEELPLIDKPRGGFFNYRDFDFHKNKIIKQWSDFQKNRHTSGLSQLPPKGKYGIINSNGEFVLKPEYDFIHPYEYVFSIIEKNNKKGVINDVGEIKIPVEYDEIIICPDYIISQKGNDIFHIDAEGNVIKKEQDIIIPRLDLGVYSLYYSSFLHTKDLHHFSVQDSFAYEKNAWDQYFDLIVDLNNNSDRKDSISLADSNQNSQLIEWRKAQRKS